MIIECYLNDDYKILKNTNIKLICRIPNIKIKKQAQIKMQETAPYTIVNDFIRLDINGYDYINDSKAMELMREYKKVILAERFNSPIDFLPVEITHLILGMQFNQELNNLPSCLKSLIIISSIYSPVVSNFSKPLDNLPYGLEELILNARLNNIYLGDNLPSTLKTLTLNNYGIGILTTRVDFAALPDSIEYIKCPLIS